jgi:hypothetical protein
MDVGLPKLNNELNTHRPGQRLSRRPIGQPSALTLPLGQALMMLLLL